MPPDWYTPYKLDPEFFDQMSYLKKKVERVGGDLQIISGLRTDGEQQALRDHASSQGLNPDDWFSPPGGSSHSYGLGADVVGDLKSAHYYAPTAGLYMPLKNDPWHVEPSWVTDQGLPYRPTAAPISYDFLNTQPANPDQGLHANIQNQATARAASAQGEAPKDVPINMLAPELRAKLTPEQQAAQAKPISQPTGKGLGGMTSSSAPSIETKSAGIGTPPPSAAQPPTGGGDTDLLNRTLMWNAAAGRGSGSGAAIVNAAMSKIGKPYSTDGRFGPNAYDCSGLVVSALKDVGIDPGGNQVSTSLQTWGTPISLEDAYKTPGAMLFVWGSGPAGHVEISRGDGTTIGSSSGGVMVRPALGRGWTGAALPPGVAPGGGGSQGGGFLPAAAEPARIPVQDARSDIGFQAAGMMNAFRQNRSAAGTGLTPGAANAGLGQGQSGLDASMASPTTPIDQAPSQPSPTPQPTQAQAQGTPAASTTPPTAETAAEAARFSQANPGAPAPAFAPVDASGGAMPIGSYQQQAPETTQSTAGTAISPQPTQGPEGPFPQLPSQYKPPEPAAPEAPPGQQPQQQAGDFIGGVLAGVGAPDTPENRRFMDAWIAAEGTSAANNPLATTQSAPGASDFNSAHVKNYGDAGTGIQATVQTLNNGRYGNILSALRAGNNANAAAQAVADSPWGTGRGVLRRLGVG